MPTPAKKKPASTSEASSSNQTLLSFFAKNGQATTPSGTKKVKQEALQASSTKSPRIKGNSFDQPVVISDDEDSVAPTPSRPAAVASRSRARSNESKGQGLQSNGLLARRMSPSPKLEPSRAPGLGSDLQPIDVELWDDDQEEGMGMDDPEEDQLIEDLEAFEIESNVGEGSSRRNSSRKAMEVDSAGDVDDADADALNPTTSGHKRKTQRRPPRSRPKSDESGEDERSDLDDPAESNACPVCGKTFVAMTDDVSGCRVDVNSFPLTSVADLLQGKANARQHMPR